MEANRTTGSARSAAVDYRRNQGWCPIPIKNRSKQTALPQLAPYLIRPATSDELGSWSWPGVGIVTGPASNLLVLDVDGLEGEAELKKRGHPITPMVRTANGGLHLYFRHPDAEVRTGIRVAPGLDVKASGGYVVAPPSVGPNGKAYEWIVSPEEAELADVPEWLIGLLSRPRRNGAAPVGERIPTGRRNQELTSIAGSMRRRGMGEAEIFAALSVANERRCDPPLEEGEVRKIAASVSRYEPAGDVIAVSFNGRGGAKASGGFNLTDLGNAERFVANHGEDVRYCYPWGKWLVWTGVRWERDDAGKVHRLGKETVRGIYSEAAAAGDETRRKALANHATRSEAEARIRAMLELVKSEVPVSPDELDPDPSLLNTPNGTVDLRTGELRSHRREDLITKMAGAAYIPDAEAPAWKAFLKRVLPSDELRAFVHRGSGYSATGDTSEQCLFINYGTGANGKSTFQETLGTALGDYATRTPTEMLLAKRAGGVPNDVARLKGARFVSASETEEGRRLAESLIKDLTGQDTISARFMRAEWFDFKPTHKLWLSTNHKPEIRGTDNAIWRRIRLVPWGVTIPKGEQDRKLSEKLQAELSGVLAWVVRGCQQWYREGLRAPDDVRRATAEYRAAMDVLAAFIGEECVVDPGASAPAGALYQRYKAWCEGTGEKPVSQRRFGEQLKERAFERQRISSGPNKGKYEYLGIGLLTENDGPEAAEHGEPSESSRASSEQLGGQPFTGENSLQTSHFMPAWKAASEQSERKTHISTSKNKPRGVMCEKGSLHSLHSPLAVVDVLHELRKQNSGPAKTLAACHEIPSDERLEYLTKAVLVAKGMDTAEWRRHRDVVEEAAAQLEGDHGA